MQRIRRGASLAQYAIVIALVMTAIIPGYFLYGKQVVDILTQYTNIFAGINGIIGSNITGPSTPAPPPSGPPAGPPEVPPPAVVGPLGGTSTAPATDCSSGSCTIDYGSFMLTGLPEDFPIAVETTGGAGGMESMAQLLDILAAAQESGAIDLDNGSLRDLANLGHDLAHQESVYETDMVNMLATGTSSIDFGFQCALDDGLALTHTDFNNALAAITYSPDDPNAANIQIIVETLSSQINDLYANLYPQLHAMADKGIGYVPTEDEMNAILHPQASLVTDVDSQIICQTGAGEDYESYCH